MTEVGFERRFEKETKTNCNVTGETSYHWANLREVQRNRNIHGV